MSTTTTHHGIIVGVDGSPPAKVAVDWAARDASLRGLPLTLVHVMLSPMMRRWAELAAAADFQEWFESNGRQVLADARTIAEEATKGSAGVRVETELVTGGARPTLIDLSKDAAMVVVGCRGLGAIGRRVLGSVSWGLVHHAHCPVAVIHDEDPLMPQPAMAPVVVGIDGSPASESATAIALEEASRRGVELVAVHAWSDYTYDDFPGVAFSSQLEEQANETPAERLAGRQERYPAVAVQRVAGEVAGERLYPNVLGDVCGFIGDIGCAADHQQSQAGDARDPGCGVAGELEFPRFAGDFAISR